MSAAVEGDKWSAASPGRTLPPGKTRYPFYRRLGGPQGRSGRAENLVPTGIRSRTSQPVVSHYTDWATRPTHVQHTTPQRYIKPSSWRWTLGCETCRSRQKLKIKILIWECCICWFVLFKYDSWNVSCYIFIYVWFFPTLFSASGPYEWLLPLGVSTKFCNYASFIIFHLC